MIDSPFGVIDIGTNTFHLLIVIQKEEAFSILHKERVYVKLGEGGVQQILPKAFERGINAMLLFKKLLDKFNCKNFKCIGTAAMRVCSNADQFKSQVASQTGIEIEVITGLEEANYIFKGVKKAYPLKNENALIMDIGGGSVEFIIANKTNIRFSESYPIGIAILKEQFHTDDPMLPNQKDLLKNFVLNKIGSLTNAIKLYKPKVLVGSSGTFEVLDTNLKNCIVLNKNCFEINLNDFLSFSDFICTNDIANIRASKLVPENRIDLISVAIQLIKITLDLTQVKQIFSSRYALKEGVLAEILKLNLD